MLTNKLKLKTLSPGNWLYPLIAVLYLGAVITIFASSIRFLADTLDSAFTPAQNQIAADKLLTLNLADYNIVANKLGLDKSKPVLSETEDLTAETAIAPADATSSETDDPITLPVLATASPAADPKVANQTALTLRIAVINSTKTPGVAAELKSRLVAAGYPVDKIGNQTKVEPNTVIKIKSGLDRTEAALLVINKIVSEKYNFRTDTLPIDSDYDLEIVIGNN